MNKDPQYLSHDRSNNISTKAASRMRSAASFKSSPKKQQEDFNINSYLPRTSAKYRDDLKCLSFLLDKEAIFNACDCKNIRCRPGKDPKRMRQYTS